jgi:hypothetical protein
MRPISGNDGGEPKPRKAERGIAEDLDQDLRDLTGE